MASVLRPETRRKRPGTSERGIAACALASQRSRVGCIRGLASGPGGLLQQVERSAPPTFLPRFISSFTCVTIESSPMPTLSRFTNDDLPDHFAHQIRDFIRIHWFDAFQYDVYAPAMSHDLRPVYFVVAEEPALFSHAAAVTRSVECNGQTYPCGGLSAVLTYPAFWKRGYATQVVQAATDYLNAGPFDVALLWTHPDDGHFYGPSAGSITRPSAPLSGRGHRRSSTMPLP